MAASRRVRILPAASAELQDGAGWYAESSKAAASQFLDAFESAAERIAEFPGSGAPLDDRVRGVLLVGFPWQVVYLPEDPPLVIAIAHTARRPGYWRGRLPPLS